MSNRAQTGQIATGHTVVGLSDVRVTTNITFQEREIHRIIETPKTFGYSPRRIFDDHTSTPHHSKRLQKQRSHAIGEISKSTDNHINNNIETTGIRTIWQNIHNCTQSMTNRKRKVTRSNNCPRQLTQLPMTADQTGLQDSI